MKIDPGYDEPPFIGPSEVVCPGCDEPVCCCEVCCPRCHEPVMFVDGLIGPERWKHVATGKAACTPTCAKCQQPATHKVLKHGQFSHWECTECAATVLRIDET